MNIKEAEKIINIKSKYLEEIQIACKDILNNHQIAEKARNYLSNRISLHNQNFFDIGYFPEDEYLDVLFEKVSKKKIEALGITYPHFIQDNDNKIQIDRSILSNNNIIIPYRDVYGNIKSLIGRTLLSDDDRKIKNVVKYKYTNFKQSLALFGLFYSKTSIVQNDSVIIVEGQIDCISCYEHGICNVISLGGSSLTKKQFQLLRRYTNNIYLLLDNDIAGIKSRDKIIKKYSQFANVKYLTIPEKYKDIDEYLHETKDKIIFKEINVR